MHLLILPEITTDAKNERFFWYRSFKCKKDVAGEKPKPARNGSKYTGRFYANMENNAHGKHFNLLHLFKLSKLFNCDINEFFKEISERDGGKQEQIWREI